MTRSIETLQATIIGCLAICFWASAVPFIRMISESIGPIMLIALQYSIGGIIGLLYNVYANKNSSYSFLKYRAFYVRTALFVLHVFFLFLAISSVERKDVPLITLLNYLWPTFTIILSYRQWLSLLVL
jgi:drug/metabolite transporter (DMT)-like permease